jgi:excisionase family DNA binding protein
MPTSAQAEGALMTEPWVSVDDVAVHLGVAKDSVYRWIDSKRMPAHKIGKLWKFKLSEIDEWVRGGGANEQPAKRLPPARKGKLGKKR